VISSEELHTFAALLGSRFEPAELFPERQEELQLRGIVALLEESANEQVEATGLLFETAAKQPLEGVRTQAFHALVRLSQAGNPAAVDALYRLAVEHNHLAARQNILTHAWKTQRAGLGALFHWFTCLSSGEPFPQEHLPALTQGYLQEASPALQERLLDSAGRHHEENWARILNTVRDVNETSVLALIERYPSFRPVERQIALEQLDRLASGGAPPEQRAARSALCLLFIRYEDLDARRLVQENGYLPEDPQTRALFFFLAGLWNEYEALDFDHSLLIDAYENAGRSLRRRLLEHSRQTGQMEWVRSLGGSGEVRWLNDLTDADWDLSIRRLEEQNQLADLWRLAQVAPPVWAAAILDRLTRRGWQPDGAEEREGFARLARLARESLADPLSIRPKKALNAPFAEITCLAMHPNGRVIAAGSNDQHVYQWDLPDGMLRKPPLIGPSPLTRALVYSPDGDLLAAANGDNRIRAFRLPGGSLVKNFEGHRAMIRGLAISPDGRTLYSAGFDGTLRFWRFPHGTELKTIKPGAGEIFSLALGAGGRHLVTAGTDCLIQVWTLPEGTLAREITGHTDTITHLAASPNSELIASAARDGTVRLWNYSSGGLVRTITNPGGPITALCIHPNDQVLMGGRANGEVMMWSLSTGRLLDILPGHRQPISGLALSPEGDMLFSASSSTAGIMSHLEVWDLRTFLTIRLPGEVARPGAVNALVERLKAPNLAGSEKKWLTFSAELARWRQRYDIEIADFNAIRIGEFDIEL